MRAGAGGADDLGDEGAHPLSLADVGTPTTLCINISAQEIPTCWAQSAQIIRTTLSDGLGANAAAIRKTAARTQPTPASAARRKMRSERYPTTRIVTTAKPKMTKVR